MMKNIYHKKIWNLSMKQSYVEPPTIPPIKSKQENKSDKYFVKIKLSKDMTSDMLELYNFKMDLFENGNPEEFLLFVKNFNTTIALSGTLVTGAKNRYLRTLVRGEALHKFDMLPSDM